MPDSASKPPLWERLKNARLVQALLVYLGAAWVILQITETLQGLLSLPEWIGPVEVLFLLLGMVVVLATAWVQSLPQTTAAEDAGEVPTDWEVDAADVVASLKAGRLPHLTWGRAVLAVAVALSLLFGSAGLWVLVSGPVRLAGPTEAGAAMAADGIAVLPFHVTGEGLEVYREGMVDLMAANLDGLSDFRAIDARTVLARWNRDIGETTEAELDAALRVAAGTGARYAVVGSGVEAGERIRFTAEIYDLTNGSQVGNGAQVEGLGEEVLGLVDALSVGVVRSVLDAGGRGPQVHDFRLASLLTESVPALRHYLEGYAAFRRTRFSEARAALEMAVEEDSTFALAYWRLGEAIGWTSDITNPESFAAKRKAKELGARLPKREETLLDIGFAIAEGTIQHEMGRLRSYIQRYPDDPDGWYYLVEAGFHAYSPTGITDEELEAALHKPVELDPTFAPYYRHPLEWAAGKGQGDWFRELMTGVREVVDEEGDWEVFQLYFDLLQGSQAVRAAAAARAMELGADTLVNVGSGILGLADHHLEWLEPVYSARTSPPMRRAVWLASQGRIQELLRLIDEHSASSELLGAIFVVLPEWYHLGAVSEDQMRNVWEALRSTRDPFGWFSRIVVAASLTGTEGETLYRDDWDSYVDGIWMTASPEADSAVVWSAIEESGKVFEAESMAATGDPAGALRLYRSVETEGIESLIQAVSIWEARFAAAAGNWEEAIPLLEGQSLHPWFRTFAKYWLGKGYEATSDTARALEAYGAFLSRTAAGDPGLARVEEVREAVARLGG